MLVILGGSSPWTIDLVDRLAATDVTLVGRDPSALAAIRRFLARHSGMSIEATTDAERALESASIVVCQARIGGWDGRRQDETGPPGWGHYGDETLGVGGLRSALRARATLKMWAQRAGTASVVMISNPTDLLARWWAHHGAGPVISACEAPTVLLATLPPGTHYLGVNHLGWALTPAGERVGTRWLSIPTALASHVKRQAIARPRATMLSELSAALRVAIARDDAVEYCRLLALRPPFWYESLVAPLLRAILHNEPFYAVVGLPNRGRLPSLPDDLIVESLSALGAADPAAIPVDLVSDVERLALARQRAWDVLLEPSAKTIEEFIDADIFCRAGPPDPAMISWLLEV
jgi:hypothetical protein